MWDDDERLRNFKLIDKRWSGSPPQYFQSINSSFCQISSQSPQIIADMASTSGTEKNAPSNETIPISVEFT